MRTGFIRGDHLHNAVGVALLLALSLYCVFFVAVLVEIALKAIAMWK